MIYDKESLQKSLEMVATHFQVKDVIIPLPGYMLGPNWTDEQREKRGFTLQPDGSWGKLETSMAFYNEFKTDVEDLYARYRKASQENDALHKKVYQLEYGCRVAAKAIEKSMNLTEGF